MTRLRVMTFNIRGDYDQPPLDWRSRADLNVRVIRASAPDIIGFQELQEVHWATYLDHLPEYEKERGPRCSKDCYATLFHRRDRFERIDGGGFWLSETPETYSESWDTAYVRSAGWVRLRALDAPAVGIVHLNTHLDVTSAWAREEGARLIVRRLAEIRRPDDTVIVTGDFNCDPDSEPYRAFIDAGFSDAFRAAGREDLNGVHTLHFYQVPKPTTKCRIDWVLFSPGTPAVRCTAAEIVTTREPPVYASDHYPVVVELEIG